MIRQRPWTDGEPVHVDGRAGDEEGTVHGYRGRVCGANPTHVGHDGVRRVCIKTRDGQVLAVPESALKKGA